MLRIPFLLDILTLEDEDTTFPRNFGFQSHSDTAPHPTRMESSATLLQKPQLLICTSWISHFLDCAMKWMVKKKVY